MKPLRALLAVVLLLAAPAAVAQPADPPPPEPDDVPEEPAGADDADDTDHADDTGDGDQAPPEPTPPELAPPEPTPPPEPPPPPPAIPTPAEAAATVEAEAPPRRPSPSAIAVPRVDVIGVRSRALESVPGAAAVVTAEDLRHQAPTSANEALRTLPGVNVVDEEGIGLRPNIGIRGLNPTRSSALLVLEDGVPIALAPYGEPELYYAPSIERMQRLELVKGSGSILFGPQTIGGVLNYVTKDPPEEFTVGAISRVGTHGYFANEVFAGDTSGPVGYYAQVMHMQFAGHRGLNLELLDVTGKVRLALSPRSYLGFKVSYYDELSNATYLGLTTPQFRTDPSMNFATNDVLPVRRGSVSATHNHLFGDSLLLQTTFYASDTTRNWTRQDFDRVDGGRSYDRIIDGAGNDLTGAVDRPDDGSALYFRNSTGSRNRAFQVAGLEPRATWDYETSAYAGELIAGVRLHAEQATEQRLDGRTPSTTSGDLREHEIRTGLALAAYAQHRFRFFDRLEVSPGLRFEHLHARREILRKRVADGEGNNVPTDLDPPLSDADPVTALLPGLGVSAKVHPLVTAFAGVHRGWAPPRTKDAINSDGEILRLEAEHSWNYEIGARASHAGMLYAEVSGFLLDFSNQIIPPAEAYGVVSDMALVNGGATRHLGVETAVTVDAARLAGLRFRVPVSAAYTFVHAEFRDGWNEDLEGKRLPYAPRHMLSGHIRFIHDVGLSAQVGLNYVATQFTDKLNTVSASADGTSGRIAARALVDARVGYELPVRGLSAFVAGKNLTDRRYIASRAPQGIQPGMFRQFIAGVSFTY
jgi:Fe(3+) dicitrate transport protein